MFERDNDKEGDAKEESFGIFLEWDKVAVWYFTLLLLDFSKRDLAITESDGGLL